MTPYTKDVRYLAITTWGRSSLGDCPSASAAIAFAKARYGERLLRVVKETREIIMEDK